MRKNRIVDMVTEIILRSSCTKCGSIVNDVDGLQNIRLFSDFDSDFDDGGYLLVVNVVDVYVIVVDLRENVLCGCKEGLVNSM